MHTLEGALKRTSGISIVLSVSLIIFGILAIALPIASSIGIAMVIGWMVLFAGIAQFVQAFQSEGIGHIVGELVVAVFYIVAGAYLIARPALGAAGLTLVLGTFLFAEGGAYVIAQKWCFTLDAARWNRHSRSGFHDLESVARGVPVGNRDTGRHQHDHDRYHSSDDGSGSSQVG
jgi:uncharacterized membrane protein HdeD (DUF308 family)